APVSIAAGAAPVWASGRGRGRGLVAGGRPPRHTLLGAGRTRAGALRASEIGEYVYCHRAWWLHQVQGHASANVRQLEAGTATHARHGRLVGVSRGLNTLALLLLLAAIVLAVVTLWQRMW